MSRVRNVNAQITGCRTRTEVVVLLIVLSKF